MKRNVTAKHNVLPEAFTGACFKACCKHIAAGRSEALTAVLLKIQLFKGVTPCCYMGDF